MLRLFREWQWVRIEDMDHREVVVLSAVRTAIGKFGGALKDISPSELAARVAAETIRRSDTDAAIGGGKGIAAIFQSIN